MTLSERIDRGRAAISKAKAKGRDVAAWEAHLAELEREAAAPNVAAIVAAWRRITGLVLDPERVAKNLADIRAWESRRR